MHEFHICVCPKPELVTALQLREESHELVTSWLLLDLYHMKSLKCSQMRENYSFLLSNVNVYYPVWAEFLY